MKGDIMRFAVVLIGLTLCAAPAMAANGVAVTAGCAVEGSFGMALTLDGSTNAAYVQDNSPATETTFRARFQLRSNTLNLPNASAYAIAGFNGDAASGSVLRVYLTRNFAGAWRARAQAKNDPGGANWTRTGNVTLMGNGTPFTRQVEVEWGASDGSDNGFVTIRRIDNGASATETGIDNDQSEINRALFGGVLGMTGAMSGTACYDSYSSFR